MNRERAARTAFYNAINGKIPVPGGSGFVPVFDGKADQGLTIYVVIEKQTAQNISDFKDRRWDCSISFTIVHKQDNSYTKDYIDDICESMEGFIETGIASQNGLTPVDNWNFYNVRSDNIDYADFQITQTESIAMKFITFQFQMNK